MIVNIQPELKLINDRDKGNLLYTCNLFQLINW